MKIRRLLLKPKPVVIGVFVFCLVVGVVLLCVIGSRITQQYRFAEEKAQVVSATIVKETGSVELSKKSTLNLMNEIQQLASKTYLSHPPEEVGDYYIIIEFEDGIYEYITSCTSYYIKEGEHYFLNERERRHLSYQYFTNASAFFGLLDKYSRIQ